MIIRAHDRWPRVPKDDHLQPVVSDVAIGFVHASPQLFVVSCIRTIRELAGLFLFTTDALISCQLDASVVPESTTRMLNWKSMFKDSGGDDGHPER